MIMDENIVVELDTTILELFDEIGILQEEVRSLQELIIQKQQMIHNIQLQFAMDVSEKTAAA